MKKILFSIATLAVAFGFTACSNEDEALSVKGEKTTALAMTEAGTRTALAEDGETYNVVWSNNDQITIGDQTFTLKSGAGETAATFEGTAPDDGTYKAYYGINKNLDFGPTQYYVAGEVSNFPMYADAEVKDGKIEPLQFKNICGILRLTVVDCTATIKSITITANENVSGKLDIQPTYVALSSGKPYLLIDCGAGIAPTEGATVFDIAMIGRTYTGVQITLTDTENNSCTKTFKGTDGLVIERRKITKATFSATTFVGTTGTAKANINDVETDVNWVQLWEGGPKFAVYNVGVTNGKAESYGGYYCWGGTSENGDGIAWNGDHNGNDAKLTGATDTATKLWGDNWRMPTYYEFEALLNSNNCTCTWTTNYNETGINGLLCQGKEGTAYESNRVFLPAASQCSKNDAVGKVENPGVNGLYGVSTCLVMNRMWYMLFYSSGRMMSNDTGRGNYAYTIRPVLAK